MKITDRFKFTYKPLEICGQIKLTEIKDFICLIYSRE